MDKNYYDILGVDKSVSSEELKRAYRNLCKKWHPDLNHSPEAKDKFAEINEAYEVLSNPEKRSEYDNPSPFGGFGGQGMNGFRDANGNFHFTWSSDGSVISLVEWVEWVDLEDPTKMLQDQERTYCLC